jgi:hypothetical protein
MESPVTIKAIRLFSPWVSRMSADVAVEGTTQEPAAAGQCLLTGGHRKDSCRIAKVTGVVGILGEDQATERRT